MPPEVRLSDAVLTRLRASLNDRYLVERELGEGGAATVYLARDLRHERPVAIKVLRPDLAESLGSNRFTREIRTAANLQHPHILTVHDSGSADGLLYYVMPFVEGESLRARLQREGGLPIAHVVRILREVADALAFAHARGVVHRDIKPDNVLLSGKHALVADFGVAKAISEATGRQQLTTLGVALGTPAYMAPEQAAADPHLDHRVDIYALGVLGFELLSGEPPFVRRTAQQVIAAHLADPAPAVAERRPATPPALAALIARCLEKQPADRWQSAEEIVAELERLATPTGMAPATTTAEPLAPGRAPSPGHRVVLGAAVLVGLAAVAWFSFLRPHPAAELDASLVAVLPFEFSATPELSYLQEGIVNILESSLTGEGGPRAVASQTTIAQWKRAGGAEHGLTEDEARAIARQLGAGQLLRGGLVGTASNLILSATIAPTGGGAGVQATVNGPADSIAGMAERLVAQLLSLRLGESAARLASLQAVPPAALRAYLEGQQALRAGQYAEAAFAFERALAIDSTFALAALGHATATSWDPTQFGTSDGTVRAYRHRDRLNANDLTLLEMRIPSTFAGRALTGREQMAVRERLVQRIADRPEAWYVIGDAYFHSGAAYGFGRAESLKRAENAFRRALALDPGVEYVRRHLVDIVIFSDPASEQRAAVVIDSLALTNPFSRLVTAITTGDSGAVRRLMAAFGALDHGTLLMSAFYATSLGATDAADSAIARAIDRPGPLQVRRRALHAARSSYWAQGRPAAAARLTERYWQLADDAEGELDLYAIYAAVFTDGDTALAARAARAYMRRLEADRQTGELTPAARVSAWWVTGLWASFLGDSIGIARSIGGLDTVAQRDTTPQARVAELAADALRLVIPAATPPRSVVDRLDAALAQGPGMPVERRAAANLIVARSLERLGEARRAALAVERVGPGEVLWVMAGASLRDQGRLYLAAGDTAAAIRSWTSYLRSRSAAEAPQRQADEEIRRRLDELRRLTR